MKPSYLSGIICLSLLLLISAGPDGSSKRGAGAGVEPAVVPHYLFNIVLGRPGAESVTVSLLAWEAIEGVIEYGDQATAMKLRTAPFKLAPGEPRHLSIRGLAANQQWFYRLVYRRESAAEWVPDEVRTFHTQRAPGSPFSFVVQADSHLDVSTDVDVYQKTLDNMLAEAPDFMVDMGDTTMVDKFGSFYTRAQSQYLAQRYYLGQIGHSIPIYLVLGNHDGEQGSRLTGQPNSMPLWSVGMRKKFFPNPEPGGVYTGNTSPFEEAGMLQDYYAWQWGDALFVVLDPFWFTREQKGDDNWARTLGEAQYHWLEKTLAGSRARYKFVFLHHLVGGINRDVRGGVTTAPFMEWGGRNADGSEGFAQHRPGWPMPIHQLLVKNGVSIVFHGHDHLFAKEELDHVIYQEVPQPGHPSGGTRSAEEYGYTGVILGSSGHLKVSVGASETQVEYVQTSVPGITKNQFANGTVTHKYTIRPR